ncbi:hypothetical protein GOODEAATRI_002898 [Goodea atripinnis]|uniref:Uncharacterized protein n=1 Tax=Goodea atripinnis TaxID=208336 RepID=A0ABV0NI29_9TELE
MITPLFRIWKMLGTKREKQGRQMEIASANPLSQKNRNCFSLAPAFSFPCICSDAVASGQTRTADACSRSIYFLIVPCTSFSPLVTMVCNASVWICLGLQLNLISKCCYFWETCIAGRNTASNAPLGACVNSSSRRREC